MGLYVFVTMVCCLQVAFGIAQWFMYKRALSFLDNYYALSLVIILTACFILPNIIVDIVPITIGRIMAYVGGFWFAFWYYSVILLILFTVFLCGFKLFGSMDTFNALATPFLRVGFVAIICLVIYGAYNAQNPVYREVEIETKRNIDKEVKIAFAADIHLGTLFGTGFAEDFVKKVNAVNPDYLLLGGDIIDNSLPYVEREGSYKPLEDLKTKLGTYAVPGNHDHLHGTLKEEIELLKPSIKFLVNEKTDLGGNLELIGLDDYGRGERKIPDGLLTPDNPNNSFRILMEHQPRTIDEMSKLDYDLYLAGHTHAGTFYPNRIITKRMYLLDYGTKVFRNMTAVVTNGYGLWGIPVRIGPPPEIVIITIKKK